MPKGTKKHGRFTPGSSHTGQVPVTVKPPGLPCTAELYLGRNGTKAATSGPVPFTSAGSGQGLNLSVVMPVTGTYHAYLNILAGNVLFSNQGSDVTVA
jgi:hypothetical protein